MKTGGHIGKVLRCFAMSVALAAVWCTVYSLIPGTGADRAVKEQNERYFRNWQTMKKKREDAAEALSWLKAADNRVYMQIFGESAPGADSSFTSHFLDSVSFMTEDMIVEYATVGVDSCSRSVARIRHNLDVIDSALAKGGVHLPPDGIPLESFSPEQTGASTGVRTDPYYRIGLDHNGLDLIATVGDPVLATCDGEVTLVRRRTKGEGNVVEIARGDGYAVRFCHLGDILVAEGQTVTKGMKIASVGVSGKSLAPHLHYEVLRDSIATDPVSCFIPSVTPEFYSRIHFISEHTKQTLD